jgi:hypothetical protein
MKGRRFLGPRREMATWVLQASPARPASAAPAVGLANPTPSSARSDERGRSLQLSLHASQTPEESGAVPRPTDPLSVGLGFPITRATALRPVSRGAACLALGRDGRGVAVRYCVITAGGWRVPVPRSQGFAR